MKLLITLIFLLSFKAKAEELNACNESNEDTKERHGFCLSREYFDCKGSSASSSVNSSGESEIKCLDVTKEMFDNTYELDN